VAGKHPATASGRQRPALNNHNSPSKKERHMKNNWIGFSLLAGLVAAAGAFYAPPTDAQGMGQGMGHGKGNYAMQRHQFFMQNGVPEKYRSAENPLAADKATIAAGIEVFQENCALCHGETGRGDGEGAKDLDPRPADLMMMMGMRMSTDAYLLWTITEGGEAIGTDMPTFHEVLSEQEIWQVVRALRAGLKAE
jgi:mono/diheme cytochrome c family protein